MFLNIIYMLLTYTLALFFKLEILCFILRKNVHSRLMTDIRFSPLVLNRWAPPLLASLKGEGNQHYLLV